MLACLVIGASYLCGDAGVLVPADRQQPDPSILSLQEMSIDILIDDGMARVRVRQVFGSHQGAAMEGIYTFALPDRASISDFAVWDDVTRIPGVILERKRAGELYEKAKNQSIDPGLLQAGDRDADEARRSSVFTAKIAPIPGYGTKRLEMEYYEPLAVENLESFFAVPLRPDAYHAQTAGTLSITLEVRSNHPILRLEQVGKLYPLKMDGNKGSFAGTNVKLNEDIAIRFGLDPAGANKLAVATHRDAGEPGFFEPSVLLGIPAGDSAGGPARTVVALFDVSLSMQWEKLERSFMALDKLLRGLRPQDRFNVLLFNSEVTRFAPAPVAGDPAAVERALAFVRASRLRGGTDLQRALAAGLEAAGDGYLVLLSDGGATKGIVQDGKLAAWYAAQWKKPPAAKRPHTYIFGVGDDVNLPLLKMLARQDGLLETVRSTEPIDFKLNSFLSKIGRRPVAGMTLSADPQADVTMVYPLQDVHFAGSEPSWIGQYLNPQSVTFSAGGMTARVSLPRVDASHAELPRTWARARVDALLEKIEREGEDSASIDEIIRLSRKYKFVTPYTSFLAVPRALLRPRVIRPGDPVLRVRTDESIVSVTALFPFGLVKPLRYLKGEDIWQTRFLAPTEMNDGQYPVRLILRDRNRHVYQEAKNFIIASHPPVVRVRLEKNRFHAGETIRLNVSASALTRTISARIYGASPAILRWDEKAGANTGDLVIPAHLPVGKYPITVTAEDIAHNIGSQEVQIEVQ
jgi:Ca-activated chloride channel family protein